MFGRKTSRASLFCRRKTRWRPEVLGEMSERAHHRIRREAAERAERAEFHGVAEVFEQRRVGGPVLVADDPVDDFDAARRTDAAWRALAARLDGAELHGEARLLRHVDGVVEQDYPAM